MRLVLLLRMWATGVTSTGTSTDISLRSMMHLTAITITPYYLSNNASQPKRIAEAEG